MDLRYTIEKFHVAVDALTGPGSQRARLANAYVSSLIRLNPEDVPTDVRQEFEDCQSAIKHALSDPRADRDTDALEHRLDAMSDEEVQASVERVMRVYWATQRASSDERC
jgi:hypothetical protein